MLLKELTIAKRFECGDVCIFRRKFNTDHSRLWMLEDNLQV